MKRYIAGARLHSEGTKEADARKANRGANRILDALEEFRRAGEDGRDALLELLKNDNPDVQAWAATHLLASDPCPAVLVLERIARLPSLTGFDAEMVLKYWRAGRLRIP